MGVYQDTPIFYLSIFHYLYIQLSIYFVIGINTAKMLFAKVSANLYNS